MSLSNLIIRFSSQSWNGWSHHHADHLDSIELYWLGEILQSAWRWYPNLPSPLLVSVLSSVYQQTFSSILAKSLKILGIIEHHWHGWAPLATIAWGSAWTLLLACNVDCQHCDVAMKKTDTLDVDMPISTTLNLRVFWSNGTQTTMELAKGFTLHRPTQWLLCKCAKK